MSDVPHKAFNAFLEDEEWETLDVSFYGRVSIILWGLILAPSYHSCLGNGIVLNFYYFETLKLKMLQTPTI